MAGWWGEARGWEWRSRESSRHTCLAQEKGPGTGNRCTRPPRLLVTGAERRHRAVALGRVLQTLQQTPGLRGCLPQPRLTVARCDLAWLRTITVMVSTLAVGGAAAASSAGIAFLPGAASKGLLPRCGDRGPGGLCHTAPRGPRSPAFGPRHSASVPASLQPRRLSCPTARPPARPSANQPAWPDTGLCPCVSRVCAPMCAVYTCPGTQMCCVCIEVHTCAGVCVCMEVQVAVHAAGRVCGGACICIHTCAHMFCVCMGSHVPCALQARGWVCGVHG